MTQMLTVSNSPVSFDPLRYDTKRTIDDAMALSVSSSR